jgi:hypothetical protein
MFARIALPGLLVVSLTRVLQIFKPLSEYRISRSNPPASRCSLCY